MASRYKYYPVHDCENVEMYQEGGFHPVDIGDSFSNNRYTVIHKLGFGAYSTVWLAKDNNWQRYVALKIQGANSSEDSHELKIHQHLQFRPARSNHIITLLDHFWIEGPNGKHLCLAFELGGPSLAAIREKRKFRPDVVRDMAKQLAQGLQHLHEAGIASGDLTPANALLRLTDIGHWSVEDVYGHFGKPEPIEMRLNGEGELDEHAPKRVYEPIDPTKIKIELLRPELMFIDLGEAYLVDEPSEGFAMNLAYSAPESIFFGERPGQNADIWALACIWFELRARKRLFSGSLGSAYVLQEEMENAVGPLPQAFAKKLQAEEIAQAKEYHRNLPIIDKARAVWMRFRTRVKRGVSMVSKSAPSEDGQAQLLINHVPRGQPLVEHIAAIGKWKTWCHLTLEERKQVVKEFNKAAMDPEVEITDAEVDTGNPPPGPLPEAEAKAFEAVLRSMLKFIPEERISVNKLLEDPWLNMKDESDRQGAWMEQYHVGKEFSIRYGDRTLFEFK